MSKFKEIYDNKSSYLTGNLAGNSRNNQELIDKIKRLRELAAAAKDAARETAANAKEKIKKA